MKKPDAVVFRFFSRAIRDYHLIEDGDRVLVAVSGGKDSLLLAWLLADVRPRSPARYDLHAVTIDLGLGYDYSRISKFLESLEIPYHIEETQIAQVVRSYPTRKTACSLCANLRRGSLYSYASRNGFGKVALGHHLDDAIETLMLNMFYQGNFRCFHPRTYLSRTRVTAIRPLVYLEERDVEISARRLDLPVISATCPLVHETCRKTMKDLTERLAQACPGVRNNLRTVLRRLWLSGSPAGPQGLSFSEE